MFTKSRIGKLVLIVSICLITLFACDIDFAKEYREKLLSFDGLDLRENQVTIVPEKENTFTLSTGIKGRYSYKWYSCDSKMGNKELVSTDEIPTLQWAGGKGIKYYYCVVTDNDTDIDKKSRVFKVAKTGLPLLAINTENSEKITSSKEDSAKKKGNFTLYKASNSKVEKKQEGGIDEIYAHGNSTLVYEKIPYNVKLADKKVLLTYSDLEEDNLKSKKWVLFANYIDKSLMRNYFSSTLATLIAGPSGDWTPQMEFVDLVLNGEYRGQYVLSEKIRLEKDSRITVKDISEKAAENKISKGGFILEIDGRADAEHYFVSGISGLVYTMCDPDLEDDPNATTITDYAKAKVTAMEQVVFDKNSTAADLATVIDVKSFADWYFVNEFMKNRDAGRLSTYMWYDPKTKLFHCGPVWDFDMSSGCDYSSEKADPNGYKVRETSLFDQLFNFTTFTDYLVNSWNTNKADIYKLITNGINDTYQRINLSAELNFEKFKNLGTIYENSTIDGFRRTKYKDEVDYLQNWLLDRYSWYDAQVKKNFK